MRNKDHSNVKKHFAAMNKIIPLCKAKMVLGTPDPIGDVVAHTYRLLIDWRGRKIRAGLVLGGIVNGEPCLSEVGLLCVDQWMRAYPKQQLVFAEFKQVATGNIIRLRKLLAKRLDDMDHVGDDAVLILAAKNTVMYDKIGALIEILPESSNMK